jgi:hypothetical protein
MHADVTHVLLIVSQHAPAAVQVLAAQQTSPASPHVAHVPLTHACPAAQTLPVQQGWVASPHVPQAPAKHSAPPGHVASCATQVPPLQHPPPLHTLPAQQASPEVPQA